MSKEDPTHVVVEVRCTHCLGQGRVPGGQIQYGEVISCPICHGSGRTRKSITIKAFAAILKKELMS